MKEELEKVALCAIGGIIAFVFATIIFDFKFLAQERAYVQVIYLLLVMVGVLVAAAIVEYKRRQVGMKNNRLREEAVMLITHEMRTGLTATGWTIRYILENYESALKPDDKKTFEDVVESIHTTVMHSVNLLDVSLLDVGKLAIALEWVALEKVAVMVREVLEKYRMGAQVKGITLSAKINLDYARKAEIDMLRLRIVLENFLENAFQYARENGSEITVTVDNDATNMRLNVADTGIGIPKEEQGKIFSQFYRASNARKKLSTGSGIGLYMCRQYVLAHRGTIRFESQENKGTAFFVTIPLNTSEDVKAFLEKI